MLLVTGGLSLKQVAKIKSEAGLANIDVSVGVPSHRQTARTTTDRAMDARPSMVHARTNDAQCTTEVCITAASSSNDDRSAATTSYSASSVSGSSKGRASLKALKENRAPSLTYVSGGQVRGARMPHDSIKRHPLKPKLKGTNAAVKLSSLHIKPSSSQVSSARQQ